MISTIFGDVPEEELNRGTRVVDREPDFTNVPPSGQFKTGDVVYTTVPGPYNMYTGNSSQFNGAKAEEIAQEIARRVTGQWDWQGVMTIQGPSGMKNLGNRYLRQRSPGTSIRIGEEVLGEGVSRYFLTYAGA